MWYSGLSSMRMLACGSVLPCSVNQWHSWLICALSAACGSACGGNRVYQTATMSVFGQEHCACCLQRSLCRGLHFRNTSKSAPDGSAWAVVCENSWLVLNSSLSAPGESDSQPESLGSKHWMHCSINMLCPAGGRDPHCNYVHQHTTTTTTTSTACGQANKHLHASIPAFGMSHVGLTPAAM